jgi:uncharacterized membrane protein YeiB
MLTPTDRPSSSGHHPRSRVPGTNAAAISVASAIGSGGRVRPDRLVPHALPAVPAGQPRDRAATDPRLAARQARAASSGAGRLQAIDAARGVALFGMVMINVGVVRTNGWLDRIWTVPFGCASILFVVLAGLGMSMFFDSRRDDARRWPVLGWRAATFVLGGLSLQLLTPAVSVILPTYGALFLLALLWRRLPDGLLVGLAGVMLVVGPVLFQAHQNPVQHENRMPSLSDSPGALLHSLLLSGPYPLVVWLVPFLVGMWVGRQNLRDGHVQRRMIVGGGMAAVLGFGAGQITTAFLGTEADTGWNRLLTGAAHGQMPLWLVSSVGSAAFVIGALLRYWPKITKWLLPLAYVGQLAFTLYVAHFLVIAAMGGRIDSRMLGIGATLGLLAVFTAAATLWVRRLGIGPLERFLRATWLANISRGAA